MASKRPHDIEKPAHRGVFYDDAVKRGICGAQRKNEERPCEGQRDDKGRSVCGRHCGCKNRIGYPCSQHGRANGRCNNHGAESLAGPEAPAWKDGATSKFAAVFTGDALRHYEFAREDPRYLELRDHMAVLNTMILGELEEAKLGQGRALWEELGKVWRQFQEAQPSKDATTAGRCLRRMGELIGDGVGRHAAQAEAKDLMDRVRKMSETERRRVTEEEQMISTARAMAFVGSMIGLMREAVAGEPNEREILARIHAGTARLVHQDVSGSRGGI